MVNYFNFVALFLISNCFAQIKLEVNEIPYDPSILNEWTRDKVISYTTYKGHILQVTVRNISEGPVDLPLDTNGFAFTMPENYEELYKGDNLIRVVDEIANLGIMAFIDDKSEGFDRENWSMRDDYSPLEGPGEEVEELIKKRDDEVKDWCSQNRIYHQRLCINNWYLNKVMKRLQPGEVLKYKIYFNPFFQKVQRYSSIQYYYTLQKEYAVKFKIISIENLWNVLSDEQKAKYKYFYKGIVESNVLNIKTEEIKNKSDHLIQ